MNAKEAIRHAIEHFSIEIVEESNIDQSVCAARQLFLKLVRDDDFFVADSDVNAICSLADEKSECDVFIKSANAKCEHAKIDQLMSSGFSHQSAELIEQLNELSENGAAISVQRRAMSIVKVISRCSYFFRSRSELERQIVEAFCIIHAARPGNKPALRKKILDELFSNSNDSVSRSYQNILSVFSGCAKLDFTLDMEIRHRGAAFPEFVKYQSITHRPTIPLENASAIPKIRYSERTESTNWWVVGGFLLLVGVVARIAFMMADVQFKEREFNPPNLTDQQLREIEESMREILSKPPKNEEERRLQRVYEDRWLRNDPELKRKIEQLRKAQEELEKFKGRESTNSGSDPPKIK